jgi:hypothetical protein
MKKKGPSPKDAAGGTSAFSRPSIRSTSNVAQLGRHPHTVAQNRATHHLLSSSRQIGLATRCLRRRRFVMPLSVCGKGRDRLARHRWTSSTLEVGTRTATCFKATHHFHARTS